jgi:hypothetical protein
MNNTRRAINIAIGKGIACSDINDNDFLVCCIGHAAQLSMALTAQQIPHRHDDIKFWITDPHYLHPMIEHVWNAGDKDSWYRVGVTFNSSVSAYASAITAGIEDDGLELYQEQIELTEDRVIKGIFGDTVPPHIRVEWNVQPNREELIISWRRA